MDKNQLFIRLGRREGKVKKIPGVSKTFEESQGKLLDAEEITKKKKNEDHRGS
jgi:hypothetical protein